MIKADFDSAYNTVRILVEDFQNHSARYMRSDYKEQSVRVDFIDPFFEALGWDVNHKHQRDPFKREVEAERSEKEGRVDYSFHLAPDYKNPVFFVEAKKPSVDIKQELFYLQTIKYSWNAGLPISILTDFQQFHILDCRNKAKAGDGSAFSGDHREYHFTDFLDKEKFAEIYYTFSHEALEAGNLQKYVERLKKPKGKAVQTGLFKGGYRPVDEDILDYIEELRNSLAKALKKNNKELNSEELTEAVQRIIDRLVFIRFLEDKGILDRYLVSEFGTKGNTWSDFVNSCLTLNTEYNGVVFKKHFIDDKKFAGPDDKMFRDICNEICHLNSPYNFNYIPIHILGSIYEQFLGKVVHATDVRVKIEEKPEVRKAGGVYYTPKYIVDYIVDNTVGKLIQDKTPKDIAKMKFADIACGSGSFLISVYEHLLDYHTVYYNKPDNIVQAQKDGCRKDEDGVWQLSIQQKQQILTNNVYGVDIDAQAVEVSQLSLYLKMLENENVVTVAKHLSKKGRLFGADKILPDLSNNIKCGNSLIGTDILSGQLFEDDELKKLNPFDYEVEFKDVFKQGGFDAMVGNPPYIVLSKEGYPDFMLKYLSNKYKQVQYQLDAYLLFMCNAYNLSKDVIGYIVPNAYLANLNIVAFRKWMLSNSSISEINLLPKNVFKGATVDTTVIIYEKKVHSNNKIKIRDLSENVSKTKYTLPQNDFLNKESFKLNIHINPSAEKILAKIKINTVDLNSILDINRGVHAYRTDGYGKSKYSNGFQTQRDYDERSYHSPTKLNKTYKLEVRGKNIFRYYNTDMGVYISYGDWLAEPRSIKYFTHERVYLRKIVGETLYATYNNEENIPDQSVYIGIKREGISFSLKYILGILNSRLMVYFFRYMNNEFDELFPQIKVTEFKKLPIRNLRLTDKNDKAIHEKITHLVDQMLEGKKKLNESKSDRDKEFYTRKCEALDKQIDDAVFELYGLTEEEKQIVLNS